MANVADRVYTLIKEAVEEQGVMLWDVRFLKEGASWYLRVFIDSESGITIDDCTNVSHAIDPIIDEADPIDKAYYLEVCSPGIERELTRPFHFESVIGQRVKVKLYKAIDSKKEF
ncbi:MAG: ribosome maturation factor RimP, partial [Clostridia bacterium]|nr:ribosome maturation factor RimP [Clostridia bacterium]